MPISYPLSLPSTNIQRVTLSSSSAVAISRSPFSFTAQVQQFTGQLWNAEVTLPPLARADAEPWIAFLLKLNGTQGTFLLGDPAGKTARGAATGTPLVNGASQTGQSLVTDGWTSGVTGILKAGDFIQIGQRLYKVLNDVNSNGSGQATLDIFPRLRESPADNAAIITSNTVGLFRLASNTVPVYNVNADKNYQISFSAIEAI